MFDRSGSRKYLNDAEQRAYFKAVKREKDPLKRAFCLTLLYTGCRISEALNLTAGRIDVSQKTLVFETLKRRKSGLFRAIPVPDNFVKLMRSILVTDNASAKVWGFSRPTGYRLITDVIGRIKTGHLWALQNRPV